MSMKITCNSENTLKLEELTDFQGNLKNRTKDDVDKIITSINKFGFATPFFVWKHDGINHVLDGHGRLLALRKMMSQGEEIPPLPVAYIECEDEEHARQLLLRITSQYGEMTSESVLEFMNGLEIQIDELALPKDTLKIEYPNGDDEEVVEDEVPEEAETRCKPGDIWKCGRHRIMCGDSTKPADVQLLMDGALVDLLLTDPPYNVSYEGKTKDKLKIENDKMDGAQFLDFLKKAFESADSVMKAGASFYIWYADRESANFCDAVEETGWKIHEHLIWIKNNSTFGRLDYHYMHEPCIYGWKLGATHLWSSDRKQTTLLRFDKPLKNELHPTMKPIKLFDYQIKNNTKGGDNVLDLFGGSGTTMIACEQNGRTAFLMEYDPHYADVIIQRWENLTGLKAEKVDQ